MWKNTPPVVKNLLLLNFLFYLASLFAYFVFHIDLTEYLGLYFFKSAHFHPSGYVTYMFMHAFVSSGGGIEIWHILFNMFALWMFGRILEQVWGPKRFFTYYILTGLGAAVTHTFVQWWQYSQLSEAALNFANNATPEQFELFVKHYLPAVYSQVFDFIAQWGDAPANPAYITQAQAYVDQIVQMQADIPVIGASGAVFGILLAFGVMFPNTKLMLLIPPIPMKAKWFVLLYGIMELYMGVSARSGDNVAHFAHLGGMLFGAILLWIWKVKQTDQF